MSRPSIEDGEWVQIDSENEFDIHQDGRCYYGRYAGPGKYLKLEYIKSCPKQCCHWAVVGLMLSTEVETEIIDKMIELASLLKVAKSFNKGTRSNIA